MQSSPGHLSPEDEAPAQPQAVARRRVAWLRIGLVVAMGLAAAGGMAAAGGLLSDGDGSEAVPSAAREGAGVSNILPADYVGPEACRGCHDRVYEQWWRHPHRVMNQWANPDSVKADFDGTMVAFQGGVARFALEDDHYTMSLQRGDLKRKYVVTRTVGSRFTQFFIGKQVKGPEPADHALYHSEHRLPFAYWFRIKRWLPQFYFDPWGPELNAAGRPRRDPYDRPDAHSYRSNCMVCHTTYPYLYRLGLFPVRRGFPPEDLSFDDAAVWAEWQKTVDLGALYSDKLSRKWEPDQHLVRMGISCESCHFGGRMHIEEQTQVAKFPTSEVPQVRLSTESDPARGRAEWDNHYLVSGICRQCHSAEGKTFANGASVGNSREALDVDASPCGAQLRCTHCHSPHQSIGLAPPDPDPLHLRACVSCHSAYASSQAAQAHAAHPPGVTVSCMDCHMPRMAQGIDSIVRSHRISSPTNRDMLAAASLNACNLCHLDRSIQWTADAILERYGVEIELPPSWLIRYRGFDAPLGPLWLTSSEPAERQAATAAYARSPLGHQALPRLLDRLDDPVPVNRMFALFGVQRLLGRELPLREYDPTLSSVERRRQIAQLARQLSPVSAEHAPHPLNETRAVPAQP